MVHLLSRVQHWTGFTPLHLAAYNGHERVAEILFHLAAPNCKPLLQSRDNKGRTPEQLAVDRGRSKIAVILSSTGWVSGKLNRESSSDKKPTQEVKAHIER